MASFFKKSLGIDEFQSPGIIHQVQFCEIVLDVSAMNKSLYSMFCIAALVKRQFSRKNNSHFFNPGVYFNYIIIYVYLIFFSGRMKCLLPDVFVAIQMVD